MSVFSSALNSLGKAKDSRPPKTPLVKGQLYNTIKTKVNEAREKKKEKAAPAVNVGPGKGVFGKLAGKFGGNKESV